MSLVHTLGGYLVGAIEGEYDDGVDDGEDG